MTDWPTWWPSVRSVDPLGDPAGRPPTWRFTFATRLPYRMTFEATVIREDPGRVTTEISGGVAGSGCWTITPVAGGTLVRFDWRVRPQRRWMRWLSPIARPVFGWNHRQLMTEGGAALADLLGTRLLAPAVSRLD